MPNSANIDVDAARRISVTEASSWLARLACEDASEADHREFDRWRDAAPANGAIYDKAMRLWNMAGTNADAPGIMAMRMAALASQPDRQPRRFWPAAIAASLAMIMLAAGLLIGSGPLSQMFGADDNAAQIASAQPQPAAPLAAPTANAPATSAIALAQFHSRYVTAVGERSSFTLPDGSVIELNTDTAVTVAFRDGIRALRLNRGEAMFRVAKDREHPFVVDVDNSRVVALGTVFAIRQGEGEAKVTLLEGKIRVESPDLAGGRQLSELVAGQQALILRNTPITIRTANVREEASWQNGRLVFRDEPLSDVLNEINRYSRQKLRLGSPSLANLKVSGMFSTASAEHFSAALEASFPVEVRRAPGTGELTVFPRNPTNNVDQVNANRANPAAAAEPANGVQDSSSAN